MPLNTNLSITESGPVLDNVTDVSSNADYYVAPFVAALDTSGNATLTAEQLQQLKVTIANIQRTFKVTLDATQTATFLNAFTVSKNGANLTVDISKNAFVSVLDDVFYSAWDEASPAIAADRSLGIKGREAKPPGNVAGWLTHGLKNTLVDYILRTLKVSASVASAPVDVNIASAASLSMANGLAPVGAGNSDILEAVYLQIMQSTLELYRENNIPTTNALPLKGGDKMVFVFDTAGLNVNVAVTQSQSNASGAAAGAGANKTDISDNYAQANPTSIVMTDTYRVAFEVEMAGSGAIELAAIDPVTKVISAPTATELRRVAKTYWNY